MNLPELLIFSALALALLGWGVLLILRFPEQALAALILYLPFETLILAYLPLPGTIVSILYLGIQAVIWGMFLVVVGTYILRHGRLKITAIDLPLILFVILAIFSLVINRSPLAGSFSNINAILKYMPLFYITLYLDLEPAKIRRYLVLFLVVGSLEIILGLAQRLFGAQLNPFLRPPSATFVLGEETRILTRVRELGSITGTLVDTVQYASFMLVLLCIYLGLGVARLRSESRLKQVLYLTGMGLIVLCAALTYSRAALLVALFLVFLFVTVMTNMVQKLIAVLVLAALTVVVGLSLLFQFQTGSFIHATRQQLGILRNVSVVFTPEYFQRARYQRLDALLGITPTVLVNSPLAGFGPDQASSITAINESPTRFTVKEWTRRGFEDVYWVALLAYYGIGGPLMWVWILWLASRIGLALYRAPAASEIATWLGFALFAMSVWMGIMLFFVRVLEFRPPAFFFWLLLGLAASLLARHQREATHQPA